MLEEVPEEPSKPIKPVQKSISFPPETSGQVQAGFELPRPPVDRKQADLYKLSS